MSEVERVVLSVNGERIEQFVSPLTTLAVLLRDRIGLTGTHLGCEEGVCGSCTVLVDGRSLRSCLTLAAQMDGASVVTIEGYAGTPELHAVQEAFVTNFAAQCGYCTPGMMAVVAEYLADGSIADPGEEKNIRRRLDAVVCRCTGYQAIVAAVRGLLQRREPRDE
jgi:carbon-monoxide dehydrogenase small subunit